MPKQHIEADPRNLRAVAHPVRVALLNEIYARGSANATTLAGAVGRPVNAVSFHLRQLAKYGLIEDAPGDATDGRERWWRPTAVDGLLISGEPLSQTADGQAALDVVRDHATAHWQGLVARLFAPHDDPGEVWGSNDVPMRLTDDEAHELTAEMYALLRRWVEHGRSAGDQENRRTYLAATMVMPHQTDLVD